MSKPDLQTILLPTGKEVVVHTYLFINNTFVPSSSGKTFETINPTTGKPIVTVHEAGTEDVDQAVAAATAGLKEWKKVSTKDKGILVHKLANLMERDLEELATLDALDNGKPLEYARGDISDSIDCFRYFAGWCDKIHGKTIDTTPDILSYTRHEPVGVVGAIIPWNYPIMMLSWKMAPALSCGNCIILKSSENTPLSALKFAELTKEAGFPNGVVNIISGFGDPTGAYLSKHPGIAKLAFTGSTTTGRKIMEASAKSNIKRLQLELGGKSPEIVFEDCDLEKTIEWCANGIFFNMGQNCNAGSRIYVQESIADKFIAGLKSHAQSLKIGDPFQEGTFLGPQVSEAQFNRVLGYLNSGKEENATVVTGGERWGKEGYYIKPTVFANVTDEMKIMREEIFGPVVCVATFKTLEEVIERANNTTYGLAGAVYTKDLNKALYVSNELDAGTVWINCYDVFHQSTPFGGFKQSGFGKELGEYALEDYTRIKTVKVKIEI